MNEEATRSGPSRTDVADTRADRGGTAGGAQAVRHERHPGRRWISILPEGLLMLGAVVLFAVADRSDFVQREGELGPEFWPKVVCVGLFLSALARAAQKVRAGPRPGPGSTSAPNVSDQEPPVELRPLVIVLALAVGYVIGTIMLGYLIATGAFLLAFSWLGGKRHWHVIPVAVITPVILSYVFLKLVYISLPTGVGIFDDFTVAVYERLGIF